MIVSTHHPTRPDPSNRAVAGQSALDHIGPNADLIVPLANGEPVPCSTPSRRNADRVHGRAGPPDARPPRPPVPARRRCATTCCTCRTSCRRSPGRPSTSGAASWCRTTSARCPACCGRRRGARWCWPPPRRWTATATSRSAPTATTSAPFIGRAPVLPRGQRADAPHVRAQPGPRQPGRGLDRGRPPAGRGAAAGAVRRRPSAIAAHVAERIPDGATIQAGIGSHPQRAARGPARPPRPRRPHRAAVRRLHRPGRARRRHRHPQAAGAGQGGDDVRPRHPGALRLPRTRTPRSSSCRSTTSTTRG